MKKFALFMVLIVVLVAGCDGNQPPRPQSDSSQAFADSARIPVDDKVYTITGRVTGELESIVTQGSPATGSVAGYNSALLGSYFGEVLNGKGVVRLTVTSSDSSLAPVGSTVILKVTDTKAVGLLPGDTVTFACRHQYEAIAAVRNNETFDSDKLATWEIDYCRLKTPQINAPR